jgi:endoplasmic reticulum resident protein 44
MSHNFSLAASNELVFVNFYAEWCRFSNLLQPIFDEAADKVKEAFPETDKVAMVKVDCDKEGKLCLDLS